MTPGHDRPVDDVARFSLAGARAAARDDELTQWVEDFLASRGSDNPLLALGLADGPRWWLGPVRVPLDELVRLAGPEDEVLCPIEPEEWEDEIDAMEDSLEEGWQPPPLLAQYRDGQLLLRDGNHRYEALVRAEASHAWTLVYFDDLRAREEFRATSTLAP